jgi:putative transposase
MPRQARLDKPGTLHHVIIRGIEKGDIVADDVDRQDFVDRLGEIVADTDMKIYAWALMTNHAHFFLRSGDFGLSRFMRRFLTGYAVSFNLRHKRYGHLFQNRYKSIVCEEDAYFKQLVRYIHLNPLRAGIVKDMAGLDRYPFCGHGVLMGRVKQGWQDRAYVLKFFGDKAREARKAYREFVRKGIEEGKRPDLVGGGLVRSMGGWSKVIAMRRHGDKEVADARILGSGEFVDRVIKEADAKQKYQFSGKERENEIETVVQAMCRHAGISVNEIQSGSRRRPVSMLRTEIGKRLFMAYGLPMADIARRTGITTSAVSKMLNNF